ncbi:uncharacterized protein RDI95_009017 isoform 2-T3 [Morus bassanus]
MPGEGGGDGYPASQLGVGWEPLGHPGDPLKVNGFLNSWPVFNPERNPTETGQEAVQNEVFPGGSSSLLPVPPEETEAMQAIGTPVLSKPGGHHRSSVYEFFRTDSDAVGERTTTVPNPQKTASVFWPQDRQKRCTVAAVVTLPLTILLCCAMIYWRRKRNQHASAASGDELETGSCPSHTDSPSSCPSTPESGT